MVSISPVSEQTNHPVPRKSYAKLPMILDVPNLIEVQLDSFRRFQEDGLKHLLSEISPIKTLAHSKLELSIIGYEFREPRQGRSESECRDRNLTYSAPLYVRVQLLIKETGEIKEQDLFLGDIPLMTAKGTFITSGAERVVVSQLLRSPGVYFTIEEDATLGRELCFAKLIPTRGAWLEFETSTRDVLSAKIDGKRKIPATTLLRAIGYGSDEQLLNLFSSDDNDPEHQYIPTTIERDSLIKDEAEALLDIYRKVRPGELPNLENARKLIRNLFFDSLRYDLGLVGRYKLNKRLGLFRIAAEKISNLIETQELPFETAEFVSRLRQAGERNDREVVRIFRDLKAVLASRLDHQEELLQLYSVLEETLGQLEQRALTRDDIVEIVRHIILVNNGADHGDDIDHLGNRRIRTVGELIQTQFHVGLLRLAQAVRERMSIIGPEVITPSALVNIRPVVAAVREFFSSSQLSQFMDQTNPLAEITHKRRLSAMGPGGLSRERAGFDVRDVHFSHYGRICPIETPEGPNIGLIGSLATYSRINEYGFIETPYRKVIRELNSTDEQLVGKVARERVANSKRTTMVKADTIVTPAIASRLAKLSNTRVKVEPFVSDEIVYLSADEEEEFTIAQANARLGENNQFLEERIEARRGSHYLLETADNIALMDVSPKQIVSVATALIPFLEHNDANRALMGANMQRQAVPLLSPESPVVATGMEVEAARHSGQVIFARNAGVVTEIGSVNDAGAETKYRIAITTDDGHKDEYELMKFVRTNQGTCINQRPLVNKGDRIEADQVIADSSATENGELALGQNVLCAFMSWEGYNFEDAIIISSRLVENDKFTSIHIAKHEVEARDTKLGPEEITRDIPNVGEESLRELDENGIIRIGAEVGPADTLVGKITPRGETELSAEEKLLRAIFGEKARDVKDTSLRIPHGEWGKVINVKIYSRKDSGDDLPAGVNEWVQVWIAQKRKISAGDKLAGRHGNKGVIALIAPKEDMPFLPDGTPVDIILDPIGVPSRMNIGQVLETHLGWAAQTLGFRVLTPVFDSANDVAIEDALSRAWIVREAAAIDYTPDRKQPSIQMEVAKAWVNGHGYNGDRVFNENYAGEATEICLRIWLEELGIPSRKLSQHELMQTVEKVNQEGKAAPPTFGKVVLRDGRTGESFNQPVTVGNIYMMKLIHLVEDKVHARSTGPYSLITQQPLGGKAQFGGQRFGEMEVWALEAYGAAHNLQEILTIKSDDVIGRAKAYEAIIKGEDILQPGVPESFKVLVKELQSLGLALEVINEREVDITAGEEVIEEVPILEAEATITEEAPKLEAEAAVTEETTEPEAEAAVTEEITKPEAEAAVTEETTKPEAEAAVTEETTEPEAEATITKEAPSLETESTVVEETSLGEVTEEDAGNQ
ncbi:MAG: DNA-directed RNA polymerase subunit beta [Dehalococcoidia bacterium]|nr:DNA-directed RNA polymerase subunit beta [Dehalococcoidia bacterium]